MTRLHQKKLLALALCLLSGGQSPFVALGQEAGYRKATEAGEAEVVRNKLFPKKAKIELSGPDLGFILNQSYVDSIVLHANLNYYWQEYLGFSVEGLYSLNSDKGERFCLENFYNDYKNQVAPACASPDQAVDAPLYTGEFDGEGKPLVLSGANFGPAYVPVRELDAILTGSLVWSPVYGKQLAFLTRTIYFDLFFTLGAGLTFSTYYPGQLFLRNGNLARGNYPAEIPEDCQAPPMPGVCPDSDQGFLQQVGSAGRPLALKQSHPTLTFGLGQKVHFNERYNFKAEIRSYTLIGTEASYDSFLMTWLGFGVRI